MSASTPPPVVRVRRVEGAPVIAVRLQFRAGGREGAPDVVKHVNVISSEIRRLDEVVIGFLKFARPDELKLQPVRLASLIGDPARANMLTALMDGGALTASELALEAGITKQTASSHLAKLSAAGLLATACSEPAGRCVRRSF